MARWTKLEALEAVAQGHEDGRDILDTINALESEKALERAAALREAAARICVLCAAGNIPLFNNMTWVHHFRVGTPSSCYCNASSILAIPTDQPALDRYVAERVQEAKLEEAEWCLAHPWEVQGRVLTYRAAASPVSHQAGAPEHRKEQT